MEVIRGSRGEESSTEMVNENSVEKFLERKMRTALSSLSLLSIHCSLLLSPLPRVPWQTVKEPLSLSQAERRKTVGEKRVVRLVERLRALWCPIRGKSASGSRGSIPFGERVLVEKG